MLDELINEIKYDPELDMEINDLREKIVEQLELLKWYEQGMKNIPSESGVLPRDVFSGGYCQAIDDFVKKISESNQGHWRVTRYEHGEAVAETMSYDIGTIKLIANQLKIEEEEKHNFKEENEEDMELL